MAENDKTVRTMPVKLQSVPKTSDETTVAKGWLAVPLPL